ncbi:hypothetical protein PHYSODRAFT_353338 [Phytophthora sojae]|uniref:RxLR effector protein n=2 Tax=Phytophthora sojae TaxID=67593 RepID=G4YP21_PHYSP|nr:hypothetical protein PHYSODRAFT_353338 [Phytophthora sojae]AAO24651.1 unknown protein [Phytophthora sojae]AEK81383.1 Avh461 [Phytophthora sojae]AEK81384.1 Avh461 [Phytophthora sojae]AEK81385.1 Avh461 [Phytophthora sojae]EGZ26730.1 hypothetical protein PHYSODRAFT_353338 [Phytophthora sojae]|eukprot:XP_009514005.1 hypothetical protein PHYSODRAFT_353338 [Phytophthora sojae]
MHRHIYILLLVAIVLVSSTNATLTSPEPKHVQATRRLRGAPKTGEIDRSATHSQDTKLDSGAKLTSKLKRVKVPAVTMENEMWNKLLTPLFKEFFAKEVHPRRAPKFLSAVKSREVRDDIADLYKFWYRIRLA